MKPSLIPFVLLLTLAACDDSKAAPDESSPGASSPKTSSATSGTASDTSKPALPPGTLTVAEAREAANAEPDKLRDKKVKVNGVVSKIGTQTAGKGAVTHYLRVAESAEKSSAHVICDTHKVEPSGVEVGASVTVEGTGELTKMKAADGGTSFRLALRDCRIL